MEMKPVSDRESATSPRSAICEAPGGLGEQSREAPAARAGGDDANPGEGLEVRGDPAELLSGPSSLKL